MDTGQQLSDNMARSHRKAKHIRMKYLSWFEDYLITSFLDFNSSFGISSTFLGFLIYWFID
jgi:hypothetical protein